MLKVNYVLHISSYPKLPVASVQENGGWASQGMIHLNVSYKFLPLDRIIFLNDECFIPFLYLQHGTKSVVGIEQLDAVVVRINN